MRTAFILIVAAVLVGFGWYFYQQRSLPPTTLSPADGTATTLESPGVAIEPAAPSSPITPEAELEQEAERFVESLAEVDPEPIAVEQADHFVSGDQSLSLLPPDAVEPATAERVLADSSLDPDTPITVVKEIEQVETLSPEKLIAESGGDLDRVVTILEDDRPVSTTVKAVLEAHAADPERPISVLESVRYYQITTPRELEDELDLTVQGEQLVGIIRKPYRIEEATIADLLMQEKLLDPDAIFYVRTVRNTDVQGIWGIVHGGLISNFSRGVAIRRGEQVDTYQVEIPPLADEMLDNNTSSFLGRLIFDKTSLSYVYNFKDNRMGRNPNELTPGQEIVIIKFSPEELISIYKHFVSTAG